MIVGEMAERAYYHLCLALGRLLRSVRYSKVRVVYQDGALRYKSVASSSRRC